MADIATLTPTTSEAKGVADGDGLEEGEIDDEGGESAFPDLGLEGGSHSFSGVFIDPVFQQSPCPSDPVEPVGVAAVPRGSRKLGRRKRSLEDALKVDEKRKKRIEEKLKALEDQMGATTDEYREGGRGTQVEDLDVCQGEENHRRIRRASRKRKAETKTPERDSLRLEPSMSKRCRVRKDKKDSYAGSKVKPPEPKFNEVSTLSLKGKCSRPTNQSRDQHEATTPPIMELCKFYLFERCAKKEKCLYLHKGFPCKFHHTGLKCKDTAESCKFSHEQLNDATRKILLKHLQTAPNEILGDFPRHNRKSALAAVFETEAKHKGWDAEVGVVKLTNSPFRQIQVVQNDDETRSSRWDSLRPFQGAYLSEHITRKGLLGRRPGSILGRPPLLTSNLSRIVSTVKDQLPEKEIPNFSKGQRIKNQITSNGTSLHFLLESQFNAKSNTSKKELMTGVFQASNNSELDDSVCFSEVPEERLFDRIKRFQANFQNSLLTATKVTENATVSGRIDGLGCIKFDSFDKGNSPLDADCANFGLIVNKPEKVKTIEPPCLKVKSYGTLKSDTGIDQKMQEMEPTMHLKLAAYEDRELKKDSGLERLSRIGTSETEIDASIHAHPWIRYKLIPILILKPDYSSLVGPSSTRVHHDPRLSRYSKKCVLDSYAAISGSHNHPVSNLDAECQKRSGCPPLVSSGHSPQDNQHQFDSREFVDDSSEQIESRIGIREQNDISGPRGSRVQNHQTFGSFFGSQGLAVSMHGLRNSLHRGIDPRFRRDPRYHNC